MKSFLAQAQIDFKPSLKWPATFFDFIFSVDLAFIYYLMT